jgi:ElaB/YqjD/DUF883 family membrane-anchored ribosome-binding protein
MESTANDLGREQTRNGEAFRTAGTRQAVRDEVRRLMEDVEELIQRVGDAADPEIARRQGGGGHLDHQRGDFQPH